MGLRNNQAGFSVFELIVGVAILAIIGLAGYNVYNRSHTQTANSSTAATTASQSPAASNVSSAPNITSTSDLDKASQTLDQNDPAAGNSADSSQLDSQAGTF